MCLVVYLSSTFIISYGKLYIYLLTDKKRWSANVPYTDPPESIHSERSARASSFVFEPASLHPTTPSALSSTNTPGLEEPPHGTPAVTSVDEPDSAALHSYQMQHQHQQEEEEEDDDEVFQSSQFQSSPVHKSEMSTRDSVIVIPPPEYEILASREERMSAAMDEKARRRESSFPDSVEDILEELHIDTDI